MLKRHALVRSLSILLVIFIVSFAVPVEAKGVWGQLTSYWQTSTTEPTDPTNQTDPPPFDGVGLAPEAIARGDQMLLESARFFEDRDAFDEAFDYFKQVVLEAEYLGSGISRFKRWNQPMKLFMMGEYDATDKAVVEQVFRWLSQIEGMPPLNFVESQAEANYTYLFYPLEELETKFDHYPPDNWGIASIWWDGNGHMTEGKGGISTDKPDREGRNHLIQEELIQSFGLLNDSYDYPDSIFQQQWTLVQHPTDIDFALLKMLYSPALTMDMDVDQAYQALIEYYGLD